LGAVLPRSVEHRIGTISGWLELTIKFRLLTYNIHKGIGGVDRRYRPERIVEAISHCQPDIVLLQEVDDGVPRSRLDRQVDLLAEALSLPHRAYQRNVHLRIGHYGNAILSRFPLHDIRDLELTVPLKKRRRALIAHCRLAGEGHSRTVLLANLHLGLAGYERTIQLRRFLNGETLKHVHKQTPVIAAGDFNDVWGTLGRRLMVPAGFQAASRRIKTFPAFMPVRTLDHVFYRGNIELDHSFASHTQNARQASDHLPMVADFLLRIPATD
jgi:endonuclease/exonuclease/phosphatase family metal-dependent hydrolase